MNASDVAILKLLSEGKTAREISEQVNLAERTVKDRLEKLRDGMGARNSTELAYKFGVLSKLQFYECKR